MTTYNDPTTPMFRRAKPVISRDLSAVPPDLLPAAAHPPPPPAPPPALIKPARPGDVPVLDPTKYSQRRRKRSHVRLYRWAELTAGLSCVATVTAIACLALGDRQIGQLASLAAVAFGFGAIAVSWPTRLSSRVLGYAIAAAIVAILITTVAFALPASLFEDPPPDKPESLEPARSKRKG
jgi:hypothetical protein